MHFDPNDFVSKKETMKCKINQIPVNSSDAITGHKLQGLAKDQLIVKVLMKQVYNVDICYLMYQEWGPLKVYFY